MKSPPPFDSELIFVRASSKEQLRALVLVLCDFTAWALASAQRPPRQPETLLKNLAYTLNCHSFRQEQDLRNNQQSSTSESTCGLYRLAIITSDWRDLHNKLTQIAQLLKNPAVQRLNDENAGIYYMPPEQITHGKVAFIYPGLGSAYVNMLAELRCQFAEIRTPFEIIDATALRNGATTAPSGEIFPADGDTAATTQSLAASDFAVIAVLLAEYALFELLSQLHIKADALIGCSTGEFAAITTGGAINVHSAIDIFYKLSTRLIGAIPSSELAHLRSLRIFASSARIANLLTRWHDAIYLTADLGPEHIMVTGKQQAIDDLTQILRAQRIGFFPLSTAVPYHTPLVSGLVDANHAEITALEISQFSTPTWSCSSATAYADNAQDIRKQLTELFVKPIALRQTIQSVYDTGARIFIEVGPNNVITNSLKDILQNRPHLAIAANRAGRSSLLQIHHLLAVLLTNGIPVNLNYLYRQRQVEVIDWRLSSKALASPQATVMSAFLQTSTSVYAKAADLQTALMHAYLQNKAASSKTLSSKTAPILSARLPSINDKAKQTVLIKCTAIRNNIAPETLQTPAIANWLRAEELEFYHQDQRPQKRKQEWLLGRIAARQAIYLLLTEEQRKTVAANQIKIQYTSAGSPFASVPEAADLPLFSIAHTGGQAYVLSSAAGNGIPGIDVEPVREHDLDFPTTFLDTREIELWRRSPLGQRALELTRLWTAKEALFKAFQGRKSLTSFKIADYEPGRDRLLAIQDDETITIDTSVDASCPGGIMIAQVLRLRNQQSGEQLLALSGRRSS